MSRQDLLDLTPDVLITLANAGLFKRAQREVQAGEGPHVDTVDDGTVVGTFPDGVISRLPPGVSLRDSVCSCGALTICRHRLAVVLAYRTQSLADRPDTAAEWDPGLVTDAILEKVLGRRRMGRALRLLSQPQTLQVVRRGDSQAPLIRLSSCTVRFLVPNAIQHAHCDCLDGPRCEHVALAVWAFRQASSADQETLIVERGVALVETPGDAPMAELQSLWRRVLVEGVANIGAGMESQFAHGIGTAHQAGWTWMASALEELQSELIRYRQRSARYRIGTVCDMVADLAARSRVWSGGAGKLPVRYVLGQDVEVETPLQQVRLVSLGARLESDGAGREAEVYLANPDTGDVMVLARRWSDEDRTGAALGARSMTSGVSLAALSHGQLISSNLRRHANRRLTLGVRGARSAVVSQDGQWEQMLPASLLVGDVAAWAQNWRQQAPTCLRPRLLATNLRVLALGSVRHMTYVSSRQEFWAEVDDRCGNLVLLHLPYRTAAPHAIDCLVGALLQGPRSVSGFFRLEGGQVVVEPLAVVGDRVQVLDLAPPTPVRLPTGQFRDAPHGLSGPLLEAQACLELLAQKGLRRAPQWAGGAVDQTIERLRRVGLTTLADRIEGLRRGADWPAEAWERAAIRLRLLMSSI